MELDNYIDFKVKEKICQLTGLMMVDYLIDSPFYLTHLSDKTLHKCIQNLKRERERRIELRLKGR